MSSIYLYIGAVLLAYLIGSISSAVIVCRLMGYSDPRLQGSKNPGATNVLRLHGKRPAIIALAGDFLKGLLPVMIAKTIGCADVVLAGIGFAAFFGHLFPVFFGFHGGKGVATFVGVLCGIAWQLGGVFMLLWLLMAAVFRYSSLAALVAGAGAPWVMVVLRPSPELIVGVSSMVMFIFWRHRGNIRKLIAGTESRIGQRSG